jgi:hypothetical protein
MGVCIDFYGRYQSQSMKLTGSPDRVGYVDPLGETVIDPDPISMLVNAPHEEVAARFIRFCLTPDGQSLWQFRVDDPVDDGLGPQHYELRRLPIVRSMYDRFRDRMIDPVDPYEIARPVDEPNRNMRAFIAVLFAAMAMDNHDELKSAWAAITAHPAYPEGGGLVTAADVDDPALRAMLSSFDTLPEVPGPDGTSYSLDDPAALGELRRGWLDEQWRDAGLWSPDERAEEALRRLLVEAFRDRYRGVVRSARNPAAVVAR